MIKDNLLFNHDLNLINNKCFFCDDNRHLSNECNKLHFVPDSEKVLKKFLFPESQNRMKYTRNNNFLKRKNAYFFKNDNENISSFVDKSINYDNEKTDSNANLGNKFNFIKNFYLD